MLEPGASAGGEPPMYTDELSLEAGSPTGGSFSGSSSGSYSGSGSFSGGSSAGSASGEMALTDDLLMDPGPGSTSGSYSGASSSGSYSGGEVSFELTQEMVLDDNSATSGSASGAGDELSLEEFIPDDGNPPPQ
jgi:hypothetical protein